MQCVFLGRNIGTVAKEKRTPVPIEKALILEFFVVVKVTIF
jgi:hypothetical protein